MRKERDIVALGHLRLRKVGQGKFAFLSINEEDQVHCTFTLGNGMSVRTMIYATKTLNKYFDVANFDFAKGEREYRLQVFVLKQMVQRELNDMITEPNELDQKLEDILGVAI